MKPYSNHMLISTMFTLWFCVTAASASQLALEHSFDGTSFKQIATLDLSAAGGDSLSVPALNVALAADSAALLASAKSDGRYFVRVTPSGAPSVLASVPARCWAAAGDAAELSLHVLEGGSTLTAVVLTAPCREIGGAGGALQAPAVAAARIVRPMGAPQLAQAQATAVPQALSAAAGLSPPAAEQGQGGEGGDKNGGPPPKDERTWLQKNWLPIALIGFILFNRLNGLPQEQQGGGEGGGGRPAGPPQRR